MLQIVFEMETSDPDDFMTLLWLADHPRIDLLGVVLTPGSKDQCQLVRWGLDQCGKNHIPIGALHDVAWWNKAEAQKPRVSGFHYKVYGQKILDYPVGAVLWGPDLMASLLQKTQATVLVGAPPKNTGAMLDTFPEARINRWVQQGGFAGDNLVATPLEKFKGRTTCPSFNPGGAWRQTLALLASDRVERRIFVSKNVCHGVTWTPQMQSSLKERMHLSDSSWRTGMRLLVGALDLYLQDKGVAKAMHDLVAAACAIDESVCQWKAAEIYRENGEWGAKESGTPNALISVGIDMERFIDVFAEP